MPKPKAVAATAITALDHKLETLKPKMSIRDAVRRLGPKIEAQAKAGHLRGELHALVAEGLGCTPDLVARYHSEIMRAKKRK